MGYGSKSLNDLRDEALKIATEHGFTDATVGEEIALMHSELTEALEDHREGHAPTDVWYEEKVSVAMVPLGSGEVERTTIVRMHKHPYPRQGESWDLDRPYKPCGIPSEIADVLIRAMHFAGKHKIDLERAVREKMFYNATRSFKHGKKL